MNTFFGTHQIPFHHLSNTRSKSMYVHEVSVAWWRRGASHVLVNISWGNGLQLDYIKSLSHSMLMCRQNYHKMCILLKPPRSREVLSPVRRIPNNLLSWLHHSWWKWPKHPICHQIHVMYQFVFDCILKDALTHCVVGTTHFIAQHNHTNIHRYVTAPYPWVLNFDLDLCLIQTLGMYLHSVVLLVCQADIDLAASSYHMISCLKRVVT